MYTLLSFTARLTILALTLLSTAPGADVDTPDGGWPRVYTTPSGAMLTIYQPQVASWPDKKHMTLYAAVAYLSQGSQKPAYGTVRVTTDAKVAIDERLVNFSDFSIEEANFPTMSKEQLQGIVSEITASVPLQERVIALDRVLAMVDSSQISAKNIDGVKADPPAVFYSQTPAALVIFDGRPIWSPISGNDLQFAVNTNWDVFQYRSDEFYLRVNDQWLVADTVTGSWKPAVTLPSSFERLPDDGNWTEVKASLAKRDLSTTAAAPTVFVSTVPAELILVTGAPKYVPVTGTGLQWLSNTDSDVFRLTSGGTVFFLVAGRWFSAASVNGPWTFATANLPPDFAQIPLDHPRSRVLASVPGTRQALEAVLVAQIPQTATVNKTLQAPDVVFAGAPQFEPIAQTGVARAINTDKQILQVGGAYYMCFQGVWFLSSAPSGPWQVADSVPQAVYTIPISSPAHNVTYVTVEKSDPNTATFVAAASYTGMMVAWGCAVWGTGWDYPPYYWAGGAYPVYFPHYPTYGYGAAYNPWTGAYTRGGAIYGPYGGAGYGARYNATTGVYSRGAVAYGPYGAQGAAQAWNPRTGTYGQTRQGSNVYGSWGSTQVQRGDQWASTSRVTNNATGGTVRGTTGSGGGSAITRNQAGPGGVSGAGRTASGDVYAGRDGNVYRNTGGGWQAYDNGSWNNVRGSSAQGRQFQSQAPQLNHDAAARTEGAQRTSDLGSIQRGGFSGGAGSYRPSGGARGGGRRR